MFITSTPILTRCKEVTFLADLRGGKYDVVVGVNLFAGRPGLPEVSLVVILDADKQGFLRFKDCPHSNYGSSRSHEAGRVILYADEENRSDEGST